MNAEDNRKELARVLSLAEELRAKIDAAERVCGHSIRTPAQYDPIARQEMELSHYEEHGSDPEPIFKRVGTEEIQQWSQTCKLCGKIFYTTKTRTTGREPVFD